MLHNSRTIRWFVVAYMAIGLTLSGLIGPMMAFADTVPHRRPVATEECCCGTADGRCCGTACCILQRPMRPEKPVKLPTRDNYRPDVLALKWIDASSFAISRGSIGVGHPSDARFFPPESSLQALHVRLDL